MVRRITRGQGSSYRVNGKEVRILAERDPAKLPWKKTLFVFGDERCVAPDDEASKGAPTVALYHAQGVRTVLVCCTGGEAGDILNPAMDTDEVKARLAEIREECPDIELEVFVHGALCYSVSGLCMASSAITGGSANRGGGSTQTQQAGAGPPGAGVEARRGAQTNTRHPCRRPARRGLPRFHSPTGTWRPGNMR